MEIAGNNIIICGSCKLSFEKGSVSKHCSNCFACTGCEIYYCPRCDNEIVVKPVRRMESRQGPSVAETLKKRRKKQ